MRRLMKFQLCMICGCGSNFSWIKVQSASETVFYKLKAFLGAWLTALRAHRVVLD